MSNAAIFFHPNGYDTTGKTLLGRHSAGESFLRGFLRHADVDQFYLWNVAGRPQDEMDALLARIEHPDRPVNWIGQVQRQRLSEAGVLYTPMPDLPEEAWRRRAFPGARGFAICGITHTTATAAVMNVIPNMLIAPVEDYDALICTSQAVRDSVEVQLDATRDYLMAEFGARKRPEPMRVTIPLGVNVADFATSPEHRRDWRERLDIPTDAIVALYVGRFNVRGKMNPALMAIALEKAAQATGQPIYWVNSGWARNETEEAIFHVQSAKLCPSVHYRQVDGRVADTRFSIWSVADFFISFSDNIQETFGLTPVEAMAAGLPSVVTDWNGYRDTVRHGEDGFRIDTMAPAVGMGADLAFWFATGWRSYDDYVGSAAQFTAMDFAQSTAAITALVQNPELRRKMGASAKQRAIDVFDWKAIIPQYQALWREQNARRLAAPPVTGDTGNPFRLDPFTLFQGYPTRRLSDDRMVALTPGMTWPAAEAMLSQPLAAYSQFNRPTLAEAEAVVAWLGERPSATLRELIETIQPSRRSYVNRGVLWLARYGIISIT